MPAVTDLHEPAQAEAVAEIVEVVQLPAFLVRQIGGRHGAPLLPKVAGFHAAKAQLPQDCANIISKSREAAPDVKIILCDRAQASATITCRRYAQHSGNEKARRAGDDGRHPCRAIAGR